MPVQADRHSRCAVAEAAGQPGGTATNPAHLHTSALLEQKLMRTLICNEY